MDYTSDPSADRDYYRDRNMALLHLIHHLNLEANGVGRPQTFSCEYKASQRGVLVPKPHALVLPGWKGRR